SEYPANLGKDVTDYYKLSRPPLISRGRYELELPEFEQESSQFDRFQLIALDHDPSTSFAVGDDGGVIQYTLPFTFDGGTTAQGVIDRLNSADGNRMMLNSGQTLSLSYVPRDGSTVQASSSGAEGILLVGQAVHDRPGEKYPSHSIDRK